MYSKEQVLDLLNALGIPYDMVEHPAVYTGEMEVLEEELDGGLVKNLFLRDYKGNRHFLVMLPKDKTADLRRLQEQLHCSPLSFASEERLMKYLGLKKGSVSPFGVLNDQSRHVVVVVDADLMDSARLGVHPNVNTATIWISFGNLLKILKLHGSGVVYVALS